MKTESSKLIGRVDGEYYFVDSVFRHDDGFYGVTGFVVRPVSPGEWEWASDEENVAERCEDVYAEMFGDDDCDGCYGSPDPDTGCDECGTPVFMDWVRQAINTDGIAHLMFDGSFGYDAEGAFDDLGIDHVCTDCSGCGRIFGRFGDTDHIVFDEVFDHDAFAAVIAYEGGDISYDEAAGRVFGRVD